MVFEPNTTTNHVMKYTSNALLVGYHLGEECNTQLFAAHFYHTTACMLSDSA